MTTPQQHVEVLTNAARQWSAEEAASRSNAEFAVWLQLLTENEQHGSTYAVAFAEAARRIAALEAQASAPGGEVTEQIRRAGALLSNIAFNLAQSPKLDEMERWSLDDARRRWDAALAARTGKGDSDGR